VIRLTSNEYNKKNTINCTTISKENVVTRANLISKKIHQGEEIGENTDTCTFSLLTKQLFPNIINDKHKHKQHFTYILVCNILYKSVDHITENILH
jgi:hypothetical protein